MGAPIVIIVCGVSGAGKSTIGRLLAHRLGWTFQDADDFHPAANVDKMQRGEPLTDQDRGPWLDILAARVAVAVDRREPMVMACSALKVAYRSRLGIDQQRIVSVWLEGTRSLIADRLAHRNHAFMPASLLDSQLAVAETPEDGLRVAVDVAPERVVAGIIEALGLRTAD